MKRLSVVMLLAVALASLPALAQLPASTSNQGFGLKIYRVESALYPFVQVYFRTFNQNMMPLESLNELNVGVMVEGRSYDVAKRQYVVQSIRNRDEGTRTVLVMDCSKTMAGKPFEAALEAMARFIDSKRKQDQVAILAINDKQGGYELISAFERDSAALGRRLGDMECNANTTCLYDTLAAAMKMCFSTSEGGTQSSDAEYIISNSIVLFSDGKDEGSSLTRADLLNEMSTLGVRIPIYCLAYSKVEPVHLKNLEALATKSFGIYFPLGEALDKMQACVEQVQYILQNDYVVTFRAYLPVDGGKHNMKLGLEYPSRSGKMTYQSAEFEAIEPPPVQQILEAQAKIAKGLPPLPDNNPYMQNPNITVPAAAPGAAPVAPTAPAAPVAPPAAAAPAAPPAAPPAATAPVAPVAEAPGQ